MKVYRKCLLISAMLVLVALSAFSITAWAADLLITGTISGSQTYDSPEGIIFDDATLQAASDVTADSTYQVTLKPGTHIENGAKLVITIKDMDGLPNQCEMQYFGDLTHDPAADDDNDGLSNLQECQNGGLDPSNPDTDSDGVPDGCEAPFDTTSPSITLLGQNPVYLCTGDTYNDAGAAATDDCAGDITAAIVTNNPVDTNASGTYTVTYNVMDGAGNAAPEVTRTVYVDLEAPVITLTGDNPQVICLDGTYEELGATAADNCEGDISASIVIDSSQVDTNQGGNYFVTYNVTDSGGQPAQTVTRTVVILGTDQTVQINTTYQYDDIGRIRRITKTKQVQ